MLKLLWKRCQPFFFLFFFFLHFLLAPVVSSCSLLRDVAINPVEGLEVRWCTLHWKCVIYPKSVSGDPLNHSVRESMEHLRCIHPHKGSSLLITLLPLITASVSQSRRGKICISNAKWAELLLHMLTTNQFHYSVFCLQLEEMLDKMSKINQACQSGCQNSPTDGHFMNRSKRERVWQLCTHWNDLE